MDMFNPAQHEFFKGLLQLVFAFLTSKLLLDGVIILWQNVKVRNNQFFKFKFGEQMKLTLDDYFSESKGVILFFLLLCFWEFTVFLGNGVSIQLHSFVFWFLVALTIQGYKKLFPMNFDDLPVRIFLENDRFNVGHSLAHAYVTNYLMNVLGKAGLIEKIKHFEAKASVPTFSFKQSVVGTDSTPFTTVKVALKKLLILIPSSGVKRHTLLSETGDPGIEFYGDLEALIQDRDGKHERSYGNTIYKLKKKINDEEIYFVGEFATPVCTLSDMKEMGSVLSSAQVEEQTRHFHAALLNMMDIHRAKLCDSCLPIYYDDCYPGAMSEAIMREVCKVYLSPAPVL